MSLAAVLGGCVADEVNDLNEAWLPQEVEIADTLAQAGQKVYGVVCSQFESRLRSLYSSSPIVQAACTAYALDNTDNVTQCAEITNECIHTLPPSVERKLDAILTQAHCDSVGVSMIDCDKPVSELVDCLQGMRSELYQIKNTATCAALGSPRTDDWWKITPPQSCVELATRCPARDWKASPQPATVAH